MVIWSNQRLVAASIFCVLAFFLVAAVAMYAAGVIFLVLNQVDPAQAHITGILDYWRLNADYPEQRELLVVAIDTSAGGVLVVLLVALVVELVPWRRLRVAARFASTAEIKRAGLLDFGDDPCVIVGKYKNEYLGLSGQESVMLFAPPRTGKRAGMVIPNLLGWGHSMVVLDIDGRNFDVTAGYRAGNQPVFAFSPFDDRARSHCWNPLSAVRDSKEYRKADLLEIAEAVFPSVGQERSDAYYNQRARALFLNLGLMLFESPELPCTIGEMLRQVTGLGPLLLRFARQCCGTGELLTAEEAHALATDLLSKQSEWAHIIATFKEALSIFGETSVDAATTGDDFRLEDVRHREMSIYIRIPGCCLGRAKPLLNLFFSQLVTLNTRLAPAQDQRLKYQCLVFNDEFTAVGRVDAIASKSAVLGDYNLRFLTVVHEMSELDAVYGRKAARRFAANHAARILYAPLLQSDAQLYSAILGPRGRRLMSPGCIRSAFKYFRTFFFVHGGDSHRPLLLPHEFNELGDQKLVLTTQNCRPVLAHKLRYHGDEILRQGLPPPPVVPCLDMRRHMLRVQRCVRKVSRPAVKETPVVNTSESPLVRDLAGLANRLEISLDKSDDIKIDRRDAEDEAGRGTDAACGGAGDGGVIECLVEDTHAHDIKR